MNGRNTLRLLVLLSLAGCSSSPAPDDGGTPPDTDGATPMADGGPGTDSSTPGTDGGTPPTGFSCTTGSLFAGHPVFDADPGVHANDGDPLTGVEGRPLGWREIIFVGNRLVTVVGREVWTSDLSAATPIVHRVAGLDSGGQSLLDGPCAQARFANLQDVAADSEGSLFVMDQTANAVLKITDPFDDALCTVHFWAGTSADTTGIVFSDPPNVGNTEGPGLSAQFALPGRLAIDANDNLYVWDSGNSSIRKIADDTDHTVSTLAQVESNTGGRPQEVIVDSMVVRGGLLYMFEHDTANELFLESVDLATGAKADVLRGGPEVFGLSPSDSLQMGGLATDGTDLFVYFKGLVYLVTPAGNITHIAGDESVGSASDFTSGYDSAAPHPALGMQLPNRDQYSTTGAPSWLVIDDNDDLYFIGQVRDPYVQRIECSR